MAFMDKLVDSINVASQDVGNKVNAATGSMKINSQIKSNASMMEKLFTQIGLRYFENEGEKTDTPYEELFAEVRRLKAENQQLNAQLQTLNTNKICPSCGFANNAEAKFCVGCGTPLGQAAPMQPAGPGKKCSQCGTMNAMDALFCVECGGKLEAEPQTKAAPEESAPKVPPFHS